MKKLLSVFTILILFLSNIFLFASNRNEYSNKTNLFSNFESTNNSKTKAGINADDYLWAGVSLQYFIYKHTNIKENEYVKKLFNKVNKNSNSQYNEDFYYMGLTAPILNISLYGMYTYQEFFAEAYTKWTSTSDNSKNKSWEIINYYFLNVYNTLKNSINDNLNFSRVKNLIDDEYNSNQSSKNLYYDVNLAKQGSLTYSDLGYSSLDNLGLLNTSNKYGENSFLHAYYSYLAQDNASFSFANNMIKGFVNQFKFYEIYNENIDLSQLKILMNDTLTKASESSIKSYDEVVNSESRAFKDFDELDKTLLNLTKNSSNVTGSNIFFNSSIDEMANYYSWTEEKKELFKKQLLDLINVTYFITKWKNVGDDDAFKYHLLSFIISPDEDITNEGNTSGGIVMGFTQMLGNDYGLAMSYIVYNAKAFNLSDKESLAQYDMNWWSSKNQFTTLNHEMGHSVDTFLGVNQGTYKNVKSLFSSYLKQFPAEELYKGKIFGTGLVNEGNQKNLLYIILGLVLGSVITGLLVFFIIKSSSNRRGPKNPKGFKPTDNTAK
ncbi:hypothetical protein SLITO_v1c07470 [Spiroplasma litorale]|uniref:Uncharacterized protein n=1 Tax=Spiroplasma litorale TaxID=216942 RepID=A0A0K1W226_9MOLU|nr:hypothetical protein [Spiroplasma litorale]AKX34370.1 hypothetical protein SLITO_v1c07470 [Spiroplasma litorale]